MTSPFRAILLAAGLGTRLRPITLHTPKCLVGVAGEPLLGRWLRQLQLAGCEEVLVNTHYLADQVIDFLEQWPSSTMRIVSTYEPELLGTAGTLMANRDFFEGSSGLLIHADNAMEGKLHDLLIAHESRSLNCLMTMLTFTTDRPSSCGIIATNSKGVVTSFYEKVPDPPGNRANGALYVFDTELLDCLSKMNPIPTDFSTQVIPALLGRIQTWHTEKTYLDIGTPSALSKAQTLLSPV